VGDTYNSAAEAEADRAQQRAFLMALHGSDHVAARAADHPRRIQIIPTRLGPAGRTYAVHYRSELLCESRTPVFASCRALLARAVTGRLEVWRPSRPYADMQLDIEGGAGLAIRETATESLRIVTWEPWRPNSGDASHGRVSYRRVQPPAAASETQVSEPL
jgi:hypothetical protein